MPDQVTPRQMVKNLLQGVAPPRPLFLPIVFSHGARIENLPLRSFLANPTKIFNSLRQIRAHLRSDGITCYFDPFLEAEQLGGVVQWEDGDQQESVHWPHAAADEASDVAPSDDLTTNNRVAVAIDVIRRLKAVLRDDCLLMTSVTGPLTLGVLLTIAGTQPVARYQDILPTALDLGAAVTSGIAKSFVEAGVNVIFLREDFIPVLSADDAAEWSSRLATAINIVRFYEALPVLLLTCSRSINQSSAAIAAQPWDCVVCPIVRGTTAESLRELSNLGPARFGMALPTDAFETGTAAGAGLETFLPSAISDLRPSIVTTAGDVPAAADMERLKKVWETIRN